MQHFLVQILPLLPSHSACEAHQLGFKSEPPSATLNGKLASHAGSLGDSQQRRFTPSCTLCPRSSVARFAGSEQAEALQSGLDDAVDRMRALATNRGDSKRRSKQDRARLKGSFRELCNAVEVRGAGAAGPEGSTCYGCIAVEGRPPGGNAASRRTTRFHLKASFECNTMRDGCLYAR